MSTPPVVVDPGYQGLFLDFGCKDGILLIIEEHWDLQSGQAPVPARQGRSSTGVQGMNSAAVCGKELWHEALKAEADEMWLGRGSWTEIWEVS
jgi:hypothetical protein